MNNTNRSVAKSARRNTQQRPTCHGYICQYSCVEEYSDVIIGTTLETFSLPFHYEVYTNIATTSLASELLKVESLMLTHLSSETKLDICEISPIYGQVVFNAEEYDWLFPETTLNHEIVVSLASSPVDVVDTDNFNCINEPSQPPIGTTCIPIKGEMVIRYSSSSSANESSKQNIKQSILNLIERGMTEDRFLTDHLPKVVFIPDDIIGFNNGEVESPSTDTPDNTNLDGGNQILTPRSSLSDIGLSASVITIAAMIVVGTVLFIKRKVKRTNKTLKADELSPCHNDEEFGFDDVDFNQHKNRENREDENYEYEDDQRVANPARDRYNDQHFKTTSLFLDTISEVSVETDSSVVNSEATVVSSRLQIIEE